jgi:ABC-type Fe3+ transport system substrate-binding protein
VQVYQLKNAGLLRKYISDESAAYPGGFKDPQGHWTAFYLIPYVIGYNTKIVSPKEAPTRYEELLNPKRLL